MKKNSTSSMLTAMKMVMLAGSLTLSSTLAHAQTRVTVSTTADVLNGAVSNVAALIANPGADGISLREAVMAVNAEYMAAPGSTAYVIAVPAGLYSLTIPGGAEAFTGADYKGDLDISSPKVTIEGAGAATTTIRQNSGASDRIIEVNPAMQPNFTFAISGVTLDNGKTTEGGGAIVCGSPGNVTTISNCSFTGNQNLSEGSYGGAVANLGGGSLTITACTFTGNTAVYTSGGAVGFDSRDNGTLTITGSTFTGNVSGTTSGTGGGAVAVLTGAASITTSSFASNTGTNGGAVYNGFTLDAVSAIHNRFAGNAAGLGAGVYSRRTSFNAADNWWGKNTGPAANDLAGIAAGTWLQLRLSAADDPVIAGHATLFTADLFGRNINGTAEGLLTGLPPVTCTFGSPVKGTLSSASAHLVNGSGTATLTAGMLAGTGGASVTVDNQLVAATTTIIDDPLPVELTSFTSSTERMTVTLHWATATEMNNAGFDIERAAVPAHGAAPAWKKAGFVEGHGTSNAPNTYTYEDKNVASGMYLYRLKQIDRNGAFLYSSEIEAESGIAPKEFMLSQNYPNPFNPATTIDFTLAATGRATLSVYNTAGQEVAVLFDGIAEAGRYHRATFDGTKLSSGMYFVRLASAGSSSLKKMVLVK